MKTPNLLDGPPIGSVIKKPAGYIEVNNDISTYIFNFARRELNSTIVIPINSNEETVDHVNVLWDRDYSIDYFSVVPIFYQGFVKTELPLSNASHPSFNDELNRLETSDGFYVDLNSPDLLNLWFNNIPAPPTNKVRDYVIETKGISIFNGDAVQLDNNPLSIENGTLIYNYKLYSNFPNPFNPITKIKFEVALGGVATINIFNTLGQKVLTLINEYKTPGLYEMNFDGSNLSSGVYFYSIQINDFVATKKMLLMK